MAENPRIESFLEELKSTRDSVEQLYLVLDHMDRNRDEIRDLLESRDREGEVVCCVNCDADAYSLSEAIQNGWTRLQHDPADGWDYLGICPTCLQEEAAQERHEQKALF
jgi:hypothetical protein